MRASYNRFFQPPQAEHLLRSSSEDARVLSPCAGDDEGGGAPIAAGAADGVGTRAGRWLGSHARLDVTAWRRSVCNYADPNVFFGTTIVFPNSMARGTARGLDLRNDGLFLEDNLDAIGRA